MWVKTARDKNPRLTPPSLPLSVVCPVQCSHTSHLARGSPRNAAHITGQWALGPADRGSRISLLVSVFL